MKYAATDNRTLSTCRIFPSGAVMQIRQVMKRGITSIPVNASLRAAARCMRDYDLGMLPVEQDGDIVGTITDRDIAVRATAAGLDPDTTLVREVMSTEVFSCVEDDDLSVAARTMRNYRIRRLMIQDGDERFVGMLSVADFINDARTDALGADILHDIVCPPAQSALAH